MRRYLILTTVDVLARTNNREHQILTHLAPRFDETWVVYRRRCPRGTLGQVLRDAFLPRARLIDRGSVKLIEVNPLFNHFEGMAHEASGYRDVGGDTARFPRSRRRLAFEAINGLGILKDLTTIFFLGWFAWRRCPGPFEVATALGPWGAAAGLFLRRLRHIRCLVYEDRDYEPGFSHTAVRRRWVAWLERRSMRRADRVIAIGGRLADLRRRQTGRAVDVVPTGVDLARFAPIERPNPRPVLIYTGNIAPWSGLDLVLRALPRIRSQIPGAACLFVGAGLPHFRRHLEEMVEEFGLQDAVRFTGEVSYERVRSFLADAAVGLALFQPTALRQYAAPLKVLEYMAIGLPTIATDPSEAADLIESEKCGIGVTFDAEKFADAAIELLRNAERYNEMSANARHAAEKYDWSSLMAREYTLLESVCRQGPAKLSPAD